jgi:hypothetical protein
LGAGGDGALGRAVAEVDVDHADGLESVQRFGGGEIETSGLKPFSIAR